MLADNKKLVVLVDLPTHPKGVRSLSLPVVAACVSPAYDTAIVDLNLEPESAVFALLASRRIAFCGIKVSSQNYRLAREFTAKIREGFNVPLVWGGELPTLLRDDCLQFADTVVCGRFESVMEAFLADLEKGQLKPVYESSGPFPNIVPELGKENGYLEFMGQPLETSQGCRFGCTFCMVHVMQPKETARTSLSILQDLERNPRRFVNVIDYNLAQNPSHLLKVADVLGRSSAWGWMAEACIESLDDENTLEALRASRCRIIYCGLESLSDLSLRSVAKGQNKPVDYARIIRKAQSYGIEIAVGIILGLEGTTKESFDTLLTFLDEWGVIYVKLTFLTLNPGTKVKAAMERKGTYLTQDVCHFDGVHLTFLPKGVSQEVIYEGARRLIGSFYSLRSIFFRSRHRRGSWAARLEFILFSYLYAQSYFDWLRHRILSLEAGSFADLLKAPHRKGFFVVVADRLLNLVRKYRFRHSRNRHLSTDLVLPERQPHRIQSESRTGSL